MSILITHIITNGSLISDFFSQLFFYNTLNSRSFIVFTRSTLNFGIFSVVKLIHPRRVIPQRAPSDEKGVVRLIFMSDNLHSINRTAA